MYELNGTTYANDDEYWAACHQQYAASIDNKVLDDLAGQVMVAVIAARKSLIADPSAAVLDQIILDGAKAGYAFVLLGKNNVTPDTTDSLKAVRTGQVGTTDTLAGDR